MYSFDPIMCPPLQKVIDFGHSGTYLRGRGNQWRWNYDIHFMGDLLDAMLPANYAWNSTQEGVAITQLVNKMKEGDDIHYACFRSASPPNRAVWQRTRFQVALVRMRERRIECF